MRPLITALMLLPLYGCATLPPGDAQLAQQVRADVAKAVADAPRPAVRPSVADLLPPLKVPMPDMKPALPRFDLVLNQAPAKQVFMGIVNGSPYSMLVHPQVDGYLTLNLKDVTLFDALDAIRDLFGYDYRVEGKRIYVMPLSMQTRIFHVNYIPGERRGLSSTRVSSGSVSDSYSGTGAAGGSNAAAGSPEAGKRSDSSRIETISRSDFWSELSQSLKAIVGTDNGRSVVINPQSGVIVVRAMPADLKSVSDYLNATQVSVDRQVIIEAKVIEVDLNKDYQAGINWGALARGGQGQGAMGQVNAAALGNYEAGGASLGSAILNGAVPPNGAGSRSLFGLAVRTNNFAALLSYLQSQGSVHVLSSPRIAAINNQSALLKIGTDDFFVTGINNTTTASGGTVTNSPSVTLQPFFSGIALDVMPEIDAANNVTLHIHPSISQVTTNTRKVDLGQNNTMVLPLASSYVSEADSIVRAHDGQVVVIGGLMSLAASSSRSGIPGTERSAADGLFGQTTQTTAKKELVILLKPTVVQGDDAWSRDIRATRRRMQSMGQGAPWAAESEE